MADEQQAPRQPAGASAELADVARAHVALHAGDASREDPEAFRAAFDASRVPAAPGCYIMKDAKGKPIYVGKAKSLRARVRSYLNESDTRYTVRFLMRRVGSIDFFVTSNEKEALLLENSLIKSHKPRYNVRLKDDKTYLSLKIDPRQRFPRIIPTRRYKKDGARYFGPYHSASSMRQTLRQLQRLFPLRTCTDHVLNNRTRPCLYYQMKQCVAPCVGYVSREQYDELVQQVMLALDGRNDELEKQLTARIEEHAERLEFEQAAELRDRLYAVRRTLERQRTVGVPGAEDRDVFGLYQRGRYLTVQLIYYRGGKMLGGRTFTFERTELPAEELLGSLLLQYYADAPAVPREVLVSHALEDAETLGELLTELRGTKVQVHQPQRGEKKRLTELAARNARQHFEEQRLADKANQDALEGVQRMLQLPAPPARIECFDISTIQGSKTVGAMAVFSQGQADKSRYRRYAIKSFAGQDDFAAMREVLMRRYKRAIEEQDLPGLILIDGGKGQLNVAHTVLKDLGIEDTPLASIAKARSEGTGRSPERFFLPGRRNPIVPRQDGPAVLMLARLRDETHRFAITYHRQKRGKSTLSTALTDIPGVGEKRARTLLNRLGSVARIRSAAVEEIAALPGFNAKLAHTVHAHLRNRDAPPPSDAPDAPQEAT